MSKLKPMPELLPCLLFPDADVRVCKGSLVSDQLGSFKFASDKGVRRGHSLTFGLMLIFRNFLPAKSGTT